MSFSKYHAVRTNCGLHSHMSKGEAECCSYFQLLARAGELEILKVQPNVFLTEAKIRIIPDWLLRYADNREAYADYKGAETRAWGRNRKLWRYYGSAPLEVWKKKGNRFFISETIQGKEANREQDFKEENDQEIENKKEK